jgi:hypothetical protein
MSAPSPISASSALSGLKEMRRAVKVRTEGDAFFGDLAQLAQTKDLESARVGQDRPRPAHELVHAAKLANRFHPRPQIKMVGVVQQDLHSQLFEGVLGNAFYAPERAHRHEYRCFDLSVRGDKAAGPGRARGRLNLKGKRHQPDCTEVPFANQFMQTRVMQNRLSGALRPAAVSCRRFRAGMICHVSGMIEAMSFELSSSSSSLQAVVFDYGRVLSYSPTPREWQELASTAGRPH